MQGDIKVTIIRPDGRPADFERRRDDPVLRVYSLGVEDLLACSGNRDDRRRRRRGRGDHLRGRIVDLKS